MIIDAAAEASKYIGKYFYIYIYRHICHTCEQKTWETKRRVNTAQINVTLDELCEHRRGEVKEVLR